MRTLQRLALALTVVLAACPKRVSVNGQEMSAADAQSEAARELRRFQDETSAEPPASAAAKYDALAERFAGVPASADALWEAARRWREAGDAERARADYQKLLERWPLSPRARDARYALAQVELEAGRPKDALATLSSLYDKLAPAERPQAARTAAEAAEAAHQWRDAARWHAEAAELAQGAEREKELLRALDLVEGQLAQDDAERLAQELPPQSPLRAAVAMKRARVALHVHDDAAAQRAATEVVERYPTSPWAADARALLDRLARKSHVDVRAIGLAVPLSGKLKPWGEAILQGVSLALGDNGAFRVVAKDTRGEAEGAQAAFEELASEGVVAAIGGVTNAEGARAASAAQEHGIPFVSLAKVEGVTQAGPFVFRNMLTAEAQAKALAELAVARRGMRRFGLLWPQTAYGQELATSFWDEVESRGGEVRAAESYEFDRTTFAPLVKSMVGKGVWLDERSDYLEQVRDIVKEEQDPYRRRKAVEKARDRLPPIADFDAVFIADFAKNVALIAPALAVEDVVTQTCDQREVERIRKVTGREDLRAVQLLGANGWDDPALVERAGKYVECAIFVDGFFPASERNETKAFVTSFQMRFQHLPSILEASAFDSAGMLRRVLEGGADGRDAVRAGLGALKGYKGATGELAFDDRREVAKPLFYITVDKGSLRELTPQEVASPGAGGM
jgi:ABC-type branched-subunit amino acid transport system substrate-binding protein